MSAASVVTMFARRPYLVAGLLLGLASISRGQALESRSFLELWPQPDNFRLTRESLAVGPIAARDDGLVFSGNRFRMNHDIRLTGDNAVSRQIALPFSVLRPRLVQWEECAASACE